MKSLSRILIFAMLHLCWLTSYGWAEIIKTETALLSQVLTDRDRLLYFLKRQDISKGLWKYGISFKEVEIRINSLTDAEVKEIAGKLDALPNGAGAEDILYVLLLPLTFVLGLAGTAVDVAFMLVSIFSSTGPHASFIFTSFSWKPFIWNIDAIGNEGDSTNELSKEDEKDELKIEEDCDPRMHSCPDFPR